MDSPIPVTGQGTRQAEEAANYKKLADGREAMRIMAGALNAKRRKEG